MRQSLSYKVVEELREEHAVRSVFGDKKPRDFVRTQVTLEFKYEVPSTYNLGTFTFENRMKHDEIEYDHILSDDELIEAARKCNDSYIQACKMRDEAQAARREEQRAALDAKREAAAAERKQRALIDWNDEGKAIVNLYDAVMATSGANPDSRFRGNWVKRVTGIDKSQTNGFMYEGDFVKDRSEEISKEEAVFIVASTEGSRKHAATYYHVVVMRDGKLETTDIKADSCDNWSLLMRDKIAKLLPQNDSNPLKDALTQAVQIARQEKREDLAEELMSILNKV